MTNDPLRQNNVMLGCLRPSAQRLASQIQFLLESKSTDELDDVSEWLSYVSSSFRDTDVYLSLLRGQVDDLAKVWYESQYDNTRATQWCEGEGLVMGATLVLCARVAAGIPYNSYSAGCDLHQEIRRGLRSGLKLETSLAEAIHTIVMASVAIGYPGSWTSIVSHLVATESHLTTVLKARVMFGVSNPAIPIEARLGASLEDIRSAQEKAKEVYEQLRDFLNEFSIAEDLRR